MVHPYIDRDAIRDKYERCLRAGEFLNTQGVNWQIIGRNPNYSRIRIFTDTPSGWWPGAFDMAPDDVKLVWNRFLDDQTRFHKEDTGWEALTTIVKGRQITAHCYMSGRDIAPVDIGEKWRMWRFTKALNQAGITKLRWFSFDPFVSDFDKLIYLSEFDSLR